MITREVLAELSKDLPTDGTGLSVLLERIKDIDPAMYEVMLKDVEETRKRVGETG
jgi:hypothetical protein